VLQGDCNLEIELESPDLPPFSENQQEHLKINGFQNFLDIKYEIKEYIDGRDSQKRESANK